MRRSPFHHFEKLSGRSLNVRIFVLPGSILDRDQRAPMHAFQIA